MIDFVKILVKYFDGRILKDNPRLDFYQISNETTGEVKNSSIAFYNDLKFIVFDKGTTIIQGSLHKYFNKGQHNYNDFTYSRLQETLYQINQLLGVGLNNCHLQNLEVGLNIDPGINTEELLDNIVLHKGEKFKHISLTTGNYWQAQHAAYYLKAYDKALQHDISNHIFRWEIKMMRSELIRYKGVKYLSDLLDKRNLERLLNDLIKKWEETLVLDPAIKANDLSSLDYTKYNSWRHSDYWIKLRKNNTKEKRHYFNKELKEYKNLVENHSDQIQKQIAEILKEKMKYCLNN